jgi:hypothetical protein
MTDIADVFDGLPQMFLRLVGSISFITLWQITAAVILWRRLYRDLAGRNFRFEKAVT